MARKRFHPDDRAYFVFWISRTQIFRLCYPSFYLVAVLSVDFDSLLVTSFVLLVNLNVEAFEIINFNQLKDLTSVIESECHKTNCTIFCRFFLGLKVVIL